jgi:hypothetical protein
MGSCGGPASIALDQSASVLLRAGAGSRLGKLGPRAPRRARAAAEATSTPGSAASERFPNTGFATARSPEAITRPTQRTPLG